MRQFFINSIVFLLLVFQGAFAQDIQINGFMRNYSGVLLKAGNEYSILQNTFDLKFSHSKDFISFKANPYIYHYSDSEMEFDLREAFMDIYFDNVDVRIGKQQVIWGKADGVFITDIVSPKDLREFLLPDFDEIRMGITGVKADYYLGSHTFEMVWLPVFSATKMPEMASVWRPEMDFPVQPVFDYSRQEVTGSLENSEFFAKYSAMTSAVDFELMAGYSWDDDPTMHIYKTLDPQSMQLTGITLQPKHHRLMNTGGSFSSTVGSIVLRGEAAYYDGKYFSTTDIAISGGVVVKNYLHYLVGMDFSIAGINLSTQFVQQAILDYSRQLDQEEFDNTITLLGRKDFLRETLTLELFSYIGLNQQDALVRPRIYYDIADGFELQLGANIFLGNKGRFGQYDNNDMVYLKLKYSF